MTMSIDHPDVPAPLLEALLQKDMPQRAFPWNREQWLRQMHDLPDVRTLLERLPDKVDRRATRQVVLSELEMRNVLPAFVSAMIWGYGTTGYGPTRVRWVLTGVGNRDATNAPLHPELTERLLSGAQSVRDDGPVEAFRLMNNEGRIKHLGGAFFTKWLYFASAVGGENHASAAPILDKQVADWLKREANISLDVNQTSSYSRYVKLLTVWGSGYDRTPVQVEKAIFNLATGR